MVWTATLVSVERTGFMVTANYRLTSDKGEVINDKTFADDLNLDRLAQVAEARVKSLEARDAAFAALKAAEGATIALPRDKTLTPAEQSAKDQADAFFVLYDQLQVMRSRIARGLMAQDAPAFTSKLAEVKSAFLPRYESDPRFR